MDTVENDTDVIMIFKQKNGIFWYLMILELLWYDSHGII
ncbi:unnamed protein product [Schistosoma curassoni]|uniref:Uncharacterized protein n=1 Tax=Schistosoma curassoni TaxID=6186 RepID=A0A183KJW6_9TREM|nr:unnamed protein product [Schistosoma curassoni]